MKADSIPYALKEDSPLGAPQIDSTPIFMIEGDYYLELNSAKEDPEAFEEEWVGSARIELEKWNKEKEVAPSIEAEGALLHYNVALRLCLLGHVRPRAIYFEEAASLYSTARAYAKESSNGDLHAKSQHGMSYALLQEGLLSRSPVSFYSSVKECDVAIDLYRQDDDIEGVANANFNKGAALREVKEYRRSADSYAICAELFHQLGRGSWEFTSRYSQGLSLIRLGDQTRDVLDYREAVEASMFAAGICSEHVGDASRAQARQNQGKALYALAELTKRIADFKCAAKESSAAAKLYSDAGDDYGCAAATYNQGLALYEVASRNEAVLYSESSRVFMDAARLFSRTEDREMEAKSHARCAHALFRMEDYRSASNSFMMSSDGFLEAGLKRDCLEERHNQGSSLARWAHQSNELSDFMAASTVLEVAAKGFAEIESCMSWAEVQHGLGITMIEIADRTNDAGDFSAAAQVFSAAAKGHGETGTVESFGVCLYYQGMSLVKKAMVTDASKDYMEASIVSALAADQLSSQPEASEWYAHARHLHGMALLGFSGITADEAGLNKSIEVLREAVGCLSAVGDEEAIKETLISLKEVQGKLLEGDGVVKFCKFDAGVSELTSNWSSCDNELSINEFEQIGEGPEVERVTTKVNDSFAEASLAGLREVLLQHPPKEAVARLEEIIREARVNPPLTRELKERFCADVNELLASNFLRIQVEGEEGLATLGMKTGAIQLRVAGRGTRGFRNAEFSLVEVPVNYAMRRGRKSSPREPS